MRYGNETGQNNSSVIKYIRKQIIEYLENNRFIAVLTATIVFKYARNRVRNELS